MQINQHWRNKQLARNFSQQEFLCHNFLKKHKHLKWQWHGNKGHFYDFISSSFNIVENDPTALIFVNYFSSFSPGIIVNQINKLINQDILAIYLAINRYDFAAINDLNINYKEDIGDAVDQIVTFLYKPLQRVQHSIPNDNFHFVGTHGLDIYTYEYN
jgi:hypothetical protein